MQVAIRDTGDLKALNRALKSASNGRELRRDLNRGFRAELRPIAARLRGAYLSGPSMNRRKSPTRAAQGSLRRLLASSVRIEIRAGGKLAGVRVRADGRRMPDGMKALPKYWEGEARSGSSFRGQWRHPVFGRRDDPWVVIPAHPTFYPTVDPFAAPVGRRVREVAQQTLNKMQR